LEPVGPLSYGAAGYDILAATEVDGDGNPK
jgi:hypothetical protein